jgi:competence protein ComEC
MLRASANRTWGRALLPATMFPLIGFACASFTSTALPATPKRLQIYFIDVEGGHATLYVTPEGQSLLIDTGWPGNNFRDADRIVAAAKDAGITKLDYVLITHYHDDHVGGAPQLAQRIPIGTFIDHGENREPASQKPYHAYKALLDSGKYQHIVVKSGDVLLSKESEPKSSPPTAPSFKIHFKALVSRIPDARILLRQNLGDLTSDKERELMCPMNKIGHVTILERQP